MLLTFRPSFTARLFFQLFDLTRYLSQDICNSLCTDLPLPSEKIDVLNEQNTLTTLIITIVIIFTVLAFRRSHYQRGYSRVFPSNSANSEETRRLFYRRQVACSSFARRWQEPTRYMQQSYATFSFPY